LAQHPPPVAVAVAPTVLSESDIKAGAAATHDSNLDLDLDIDIQISEGLEYLATVPNGSIDLVLTDPPYIISRTSGMDDHYNNVKHNEQMAVDVVKTVAEWDAYKEAHDISTDVGKQNYLKYGTIYGKKYCVKTNYGEWDKQFTLDILDRFVGEFYRKLRNGGTAIIFFDLWKITQLKEIMTRHKFKQIRLVEWIKTNPQPLNSKVNYLTNCREVAVLGVKKGKPTFNGSYDNGLYQFPLQGGNNRVHPTQKSLKLFEALVAKHTNEGDLVLDTFLGGGTTAMACKKMGRRFRGCEMDPEYVQMINIQMDVLTAYDEEAIDAT